MGLYRLAGVCFFLFLHVSLTLSFPQSIFQILPELRGFLSADDFSGYRNIIREDSLFCDSWRYTVETNDAGSWIRVPSRCQEFVQNYMTGESYRSDSEAVADKALKFAKSVEVSEDGKDAWIFDIDETLISNIPYFQNHGFGSEIFNEPSFDVWVDLAEAPALPASLRLYNELLKLNFKIFLITGRSEFQRNATTKNLEYAGFSNWERLILRGDSDQGTLATVYKSKNRKELEDEGYRIHGSSGDQWSDLIGYAVAERSFKLPNIMYYVP